MAISRPLQNRTPHAQSCVCGDEANHPLFALTVALFALLIRLTVGLLTISLLAVGLLTISVLTVSILTVGTALVDLTVD